MPQLTTGKGKEAMEPPIITSQRTLEDRSARRTLQPDHDVVVEPTTCHFCRRADLWLYFTCAVCQLTTHAKCYYRLGSDQAAYYEKNISDWRCQDCGGPQRHGDCAPLDDGQVVQRHVGPSPVSSTAPKKPRREKQTNRGTKKRHHDSKSGSRHRKLETKGH